MRLTIIDFEKLLFKYTENLMRFTQDSPVLPDVWFAYFSEEDGARVDLLLTPHRNSTATRLLINLQERLQRQFPLQLNENVWYLANAGDSIAAKLTLKELILVALPMTNWWQKDLWDDEGEETTDLKWLKDIVGALIWAKTKEIDENPNSIESLQKSGTFRNTFDQSFPSPLPKNSNIPISLWSVNMNRSVELNLIKSVPTTKADACRRLFEVDGSGIKWAVIDSGIDARHHAFRKTDQSNAPFPEPFLPPGNRQVNQTRITATYDFTKFRALMSELCCQSNGKNNIKINEILGPTGDDANLPLPVDQTKNLLFEIERAIRNGRVLDWSVIAPLLRIPHNDIDYQRPDHPHGTHVAGILGADMRPWTKDQDEALVGMCPGIELYDLRVFDSQGCGNEFEILAALQFVRWLNKQQDQLVIHGVNLSLSIQHAVVNFACGRTPICEECQRLVAEGTVVVAAAGNNGRAIYKTQIGQMEGFRTLSITDPGNAESVITVGSTHGNRPHTYGVSYFSSRGPTGDGRSKPDLLAPGEKIRSCVGGESDIQRMDGTSMAAPHVSGAAALLLDRHRELISDPGRVKEILCNSAIDLGRERYFQGYGLIDILRAVQSI